MEKVVGILGGGQLGRMLAESMSPLNIQTVILDKPGAPAKQVVGHDRHIDGSFKSASAVRELARRSDILTIEIEHVDTVVLEELAQEPGAPEVQPDWRTIRLIQNKYHQKQRLQAQGIAVADFVQVAEPTAASIREAVQRLGSFPVMLKAQTDAYDGRGNFRLGSEADIPAGLEALKHRPLYMEAWAPFKLELAVMVVKTREAAAGPDDTQLWQESTLAYPAVETVHEDSICKLTYCPPRGVSAHIQLSAQELARRAVATFSGRSIFGVELFLLPSGELLVNEIAPRVHNSGHYTLQATPLSQFEAHMRAILQLAIDPADLEPIQPSIMLNILGGSTPRAHLDLATAAVQQSRGKVYLYGKGEGTPGRKMGHIVTTAKTMAEAERKMEPLIRLANKIRGKPLDASLRPISPPQAKVLVTMGSDSDLKVLIPGLQLLEKFHVPTKTTITSAHRTPARMAQVAESAAADGIQVIIAAAGGAAHLPGMASAFSRLPIIGVPVKPTIGDGMDSLLSIVSMPRGCPVAAVAINNSHNAAQLAIEILALGDAELARSYEAFLHSQRKEVEAKALRLEDLGWQAYAEGMARK